MSSSIKLLVSGHDRDRHEPVIAAARAVDTTALLVVPLVAERA